jgi:hypothetical protein
VGVHVGLDGFDGAHLLDGRTGLRGGTASDDSGGLQDVGHVRGPCRPCDEQAGHQYEEDSLDHFQSS